MSDKKLENWLKHKNRYALSIYDDIGYSNFYKTYFCNYVEDTFYPENDIDVRVGLEYIESINPAEKDVLANYVDYIPQHASTEYINTMTFNTHNDEKKHIIDILERKCLLIPPGSNHSNTNFIYKLMLDIMFDIDGFSIPFVSNNINVQYTGTLKSSYMDIDKMELYNFIYNNSTK